MEFYTITQRGESLHKEKGSKFIGLALPVRSEEDVKSRLDELRKRYHDARHHCYAYVIGMKDQRHRANDDGEPNHSAGDPILGQIRSFELTNTLVVVIRYFGGTKLGVSGLIHAYKTAAQEALQSLMKAIIFPTVKFDIDYGYEQTPEAEKLLNDHAIEILHRDFQASCRIEGEIKETEFESLKKDAELLRLNLKRN